MATSTGSGPSTGPSALRVWASRAKKATFRGAGSARAAVERLRPSAHRARVVVDKRILFRAAGPTFRVNIGGGAWYQRGWQNIDCYAPDPYVDARLDLRDQPDLPFPDGSCEVIFCSHVLEHVPDDATRHALGEMARILAPDGLVRIVVPDLEAALVAYREGDADFFDRGGARCVGPTLEAKLVNLIASYRMGDHRGGPPVEADEVRERVASSTPEEFVRWCVSRIPPEAEQRDHVNAYDAARLAALGAAAGLTLTRSSYRASADPEMRGPAFDHSPRISLYMEGGRTRP